MAEIEGITQIETLDTAFILDQEEMEWEKGWLRVYKRHKVKTFFDAKSIGTTKVYSDRFYCAPYYEFELLANITASGSAGTLTIEVETSDGGGTWYKKTDVPFGSLKWEGTLGDKKESVQGKCIAQYFRLSAVSSADTWTLTTKGVFIT